MAKKAKTGGATIGTIPRVPRTRVSILDGTEPKKNKYLAKYTVYNVAPERVMTEVKALLEKLQGEWEAGQKSR